MFPYDMSRSICLRGLGQYTGARSETDWSRARHARLQSRYMFGVSRLGVRVDFLFLLPKFLRFVLGVDDGSERVAVVSHGYKGVSELAPKTDGSI